MTTLIFALSLVQSALLLLADIKIQRLRRRIDYLGRDALRQRADYRALERRHDASLSAIEDVLAP
jgi:hypothetical protein